MEERSDAIPLRPRAAGTPKLSWEETAPAMTTEGENWEAWDATVR